jgi:hypothetical protein
MVAKPVDAIVSPGSFLRASSQLGEFDHNDRIIPERWALA